MERLYTDEGHYQPKAHEIDIKVTKALKVIAAEYSDIDVRDLSLCIQEAANGAMLEVRMLRNRVR